MPFSRIIAALLSFSLLPANLPAQAAPQVAITQAAPETAAELAARKLALQEMLQRLTTTGRILQVVAHPDDEDGSILTLESRVNGNTAELFTFTRGEGGQNAQGAVFFDELGLLRTLELLAADKEYGAEERFSHLADFGFSKTADETYAKWGGRDVPLADLVAAVRRFQPDVMVARFSGTPKDGHGHHQASAQLTIQAFTDAAKPELFSTHNDKPWQPGKLYTGLAGDQATLVPDELQPSPLLGGKTPQDIAIRGLRHQESQGAGNWKGPLPKLYSSYKLLATKNGIAPLDHEKDFFDGIDTSLAGLAKRFPLDPVDLKATAHLVQTLENIATLVRKAQEAAPHSPDEAVQPLTEALTQWKALNLQPFGNPLQVRIREKIEQTEQAVLLAAGIGINTARTGTEAGNVFASDGESADFTVHVTMHGKRPVSIKSVSPYLENVRGDLIPETGFGGLSLKLAPDHVATFPLHITIPNNESETRPLVYRNSPVRETAYQYTAKDVTTGKPIPSLPLGISVSFMVDNAPVEGSASPEFFIAPPLSITIQPTAILKREQDAPETTVKVTIKNGSSGPQQTISTLTLPQGWQCDPASQSSTIAPGAAQDISFVVKWPKNSSGADNQITAKVVAAGRTYSEGYKLIERADLPDAFPYYAPARTTLSLIDANIPAKHNIGYIMGAGDTIPDNLASLGFNVHQLTAEDLAHADLSTYDTIVTGVRAYGSRPDLREHNSRLLDFVRNGGTLLVQYEQDIDGFNKGNYTPYPATMGRDRVSQEEQPVTILDPASPIFSYPNRITSADFDGWVQERGLYYMKAWSAEYKPLLQMNDAGEAPLKGGLLIAHYGKGTYITTALSFYRELPNGVPGAARLFINLLSAGHGPSN